ncbi:Type I polyketide synthase OS=Streptomyces alboniger OX=132473 GN=CP975_27330 PE=4 SV=1 [Streptomyces alboniger]
MIRAALANARLTPADVDAVEAHGTGTTLGDPIEAQALIATYGKDRPADRPLWLGSLKSNIAHTQTAAGVAGIIKMVMAMRHGTLPQTLHVDAPTPEVDWSAGAVALLTEARPWPQHEGTPRRAGISSFGISGTNAHVIVEQAPAEESVDAEVPPEPVVSGAVQLVLSARTPEALRGQAARLREHLRKHADPQLADIAWSLAATRSRFEYRGTVLGRDRGELLTGLDRLAGTDVPSPGVVAGRAPGTVRPVFVFPGQGSQWAGMAVELLGSSPVFAERMRECAAALSGFVEWDLFEELGGENFDRVDVVQPVLFAVMVSLAEVWRAAGVEPAAVVGHSQGEIAAACVAGALSLEDAARVVASRGQAIRELSGEGGMVSLMLSEDGTRDLLTAWEGRIDIAAVDGPDRVVVSGEPNALRELIAHCDQHDIRARTIPVDHAAQSAQVEAIEDRLARALAPVTPATPGIPLLSTLTGAWLDEPMDAGYWYRNLRHTVLFEQATRHLLAEGHTLFLEMSPHPALTAPLQATIDTTGSPAVALGSLRRDEGGADRLLTSLAEAHVHGVELDWKALFPGARTVDLPTYAFQRDHYWPKPLTDAHGGDVASVGLESAGHPLLGASVELADSGQYVLTGRLSRRTHPWLSDHAVGETVLVPGTALVEMALRAGDEVGCDTVEELTLQAPLIVGADDSVTVQVWVGAADESGRRPVTVSSRGHGTAHGIWTRHATGTLGGSRHLSPDDTLATWPPERARSLDLDGFYEGIAEAGLDYGPAFRGLRAAWREETGGTTGVVYAEVALPDAEHPDAQAFGLHPALFDAALHAVALLPGGEDGVRLPFAWSGVSLHAQGATVLRVRVTPSADGGVDVLLADDAGEPVARVDSLQLRPVVADQLRAASGGPGQDALYRVEWTSVPAPAARPLSWAAIGPDDLETAAALAASGVPLDRYADAPTLLAALDAGAQAPDAVLRVLHSRSGHSGGRQRPYGAAPHPRTAADLAGGRATGRHPPGPGHPRRGRRRRR